jgi:2-oxoglutarate ferredoxin oxidoreductase subunit beta
MAMVFLKAVQDLGHEDLSGFVFCSGIGCASWIPSPHFQADSIHTTHGRSIAVATGVKLMRPDLQVVVFGGDGDLVGIGLSHLIHAARRNLDVTVILVNNMIYGMTGGQVAATTPIETRTSTTPYGGFEGVLDASRLVMTAGASFVARWTTAHVQELRNSIKRALNSQGFGFIEVMSQCPTAFGRRAGFKNAGEMISWLKKRSISIDEAETLSDDELLGRIVVGTFVEKRMPTLSERLQAIIEGVKGG